jgi:hypothetical protein
LCLNIDYPSFKRRGAWRGVLGELGGELGGVQGEFGNRGGEFGGDLKIPLLRGI